MGVIELNDDRDILTIRLRVDKGERVETAVRRAVAMAALKGVPVVFEFNDVELRVHPEDVTERYLMAYHSELGGPEHPYK